MNKVAVVKLGARISVSSTATSGGTGEAVAICELLSKAGLEVEAYTSIIKSDKQAKHFEVYDIRVMYDLINDRDIDALFVVNGTVNFFGGQEDRAQVLNYHVINNFNGPVYYVMCDGGIPLKQLWPAIEKKPWAERYNKDDIHISRPIKYLTQCRDHEHLKIKTDKIGIPVESMKHFPFEKFPLLTLDGCQFNLTPIKDRQFDISYGGTFRGGKRQDDMIEFYFGIPEDISVEMFGNMKITQFNEDKYLGTFNPPEFNKSVAYNKFWSKMKDQLSTVIIGDKDYKKLDNLAQRIYESIICGVVTFIDESYDHNKRVYSDPVLVDFLYVKNREDVVKRVRMLKEEENFCTYIINKMMDDVLEDPEEYAKSILKVLN